MRNCDICGEPFEPKKSWQSWCPNCEDKPRWMAKKRCWMCNEYFAPDAPNQKYCNECRPKPLRTAEDGTVAQIQCVKCGKLYTPSFRGQRFCDECDPELLAPEVQCTICGKSFKPKGRLKRFCPECYDLVRLARFNGIKNIVRKCASCGNMYPATQTGQRRCKSCQKQIDERKARKAERRQTEIPCATCGKMFLPRINQKHCPECRAKRDNKEVESRVCKACGRSFIPIGIQVYCTECGEQRKKRGMILPKTRVPLSDKTCEKCGKLFTPLKEDQKCCPGCMSVDVKERKCDICGKTFVQHSQVQRYCKSCRKQVVKFQNKESSRLYAKSIDKSQTYTHECLQCQKPFITYDETKKFCSAVCACRYEIRHTECTFCGRPMMGSGDEQPMLGKPWFCSDDCKAMYQEVTKKEEQPLTSECIVCGKMHNKPGPYCSKACMEKDSRTMLNVPEVIKRRCLGCNKIFDAESIEQVLCPSCEVRGIVPAGCVVNVCQDCGKPFVTYQLKSVGRCCRDCAQKRLEIPYKVGYKPKADESLCTTCIHGIESCQCKQHGYRLLMPGCEVVGGLMKKCNKYWPNY